jgi:hypothetical protein
VAWSVSRWKATPGLEQGFGDRQSSLPAGVTTLRQVHGRTVFDLRGLKEGEVEGDGLATDLVPSRVGVWTADCVPVHLLAPRARVASAIHAGWRGSTAGIAESALRLLTSRWSLEPHEIEIALGPAIGGCCYRVGEEVRAAFSDRCGALGSAGFAEHGGALYLDLRTFLEAQLRDLGVEIVERVGPCTSCRTDLLYSYRKEGKTGRQLSYIGWFR